ncbi:serine hydroxymethyltransferase 7 isoform X1 [Trifolium pratense]|uniref:serine hydroxymethyltransferase 7 isoform X1 n=2 Tax=Trifolium pratense TaxID=57577 RepID=UPI001E697577|nr:serine hydroxymethyltransferase 7 isoform X1 [Trifolium pratense]
MDSQAGLSLGLNASMQSSTGSSTASHSDNSLSLNLNYRSNSKSTASHSHGLAWCLIPEKQPENNVVVVVKKREHEEDEDGVVDGEGEGETTINFMGRTVCVKRKIEECQQSFPVKRVAVDSKLSVSWGNQPLSVADPEIHRIMEKEKLRQFKGIELIASENFVCRAVMEALGSHLTNKYSEGMPGAKYYTGNQYIDQLEFLCCERALNAFGLDSNNWGVNVQPYSCTSANFAVYTGLLNPGDRIMGLDSASGGHPSHGYYTPGGKKVSAASIFFETLSYKVNPLTGYIDYDKLEEKVVDYRPKILICGGSSYPREWDYVRFRKIADKCGAILMCDMAHIGGLVAAKEVASPFEYCDIVTSTTHKSLRGPRGGIIFYRKGPKPRRQGFVLNHGDDSTYDFEEKINFALYPSLQGGPHNNHIAALAIALKQVSTPEYKAYMQQVKRNAQALAIALLRRKCRLVTDGTDNHLLLWDITALGLIDRNYEKVCEACHITLNKCAIYGSISSGGVRIGTPAMTSRGCVEDDFEAIADFLFRAAQITSIIQREHGKSCKDFLKGLQNNKDIFDLRNRVETFGSQFEMPGFTY